MMLVLKERTELLAGQNWYCRPAQLEDARQERHVLSRRSRVHAMPGQRRAKKQSMVECSGATGSRCHGQCNGRHGHARGHRSPHDHDLATRKRTGHIQHQNVAAT
jgi:hypothetical protein